MRQPDDSARCAAGPTKPLDIFIVAYSWWFSFFLSFFPYLLDAFRYRTTTLIKGPAAGRSNVSHERR